MILPLVCLLPSLAATPRSPAEPGPTTLLIRAAGRGDLAEVERLFREGQSLSAAAGDGSTPLHAAAASARDAVVEWLIAREADVFAKDRRGETPAQVATDLGHSSTATLIRKFMLLASLEQQASADGSWDVLSEALQRDPRRYTLLHVLAIRGDVQEARRRLDAGTEVDARTVLGITPLMKAAALGRAEMVTLLLRSGADVNARDLFDNTALIAAVVSGQEECARILLAAKADVNVSSRNGGGTALSLALRLDRSRIAEMLREAGAR